MKSGTLDLHIVEMRRRGHDPRDLFAGTGLDPDALPPKVEWSVFARATRRLGVVLGSRDAIADLGELLLKVPSLRSAVQVIQLGITPRWLYWANVKWGGPALFGNLQDTGMREQGADAFHVWIVVPERDEPCEEFFYLCEGLFRRVPQLIGLPDAIVKVEATGHRGDFYIHAPPSKTIYDRVVRLFRAISNILRNEKDAPGIAFDHLVEQQDTLRATIKAAQEAQAQAEKHRREAEAALEVKSQFLATMSHELRTPLNGIMGVAELLSLTELTPTQQEYTATIRDSGETLLAVINDILDYSKLEAGRFDSELSTFSVRDLVADVLDLFSGRAHIRGLELVGHVEPGVPLLVNGNHRAIRQILQNLVNNAVKFTDRGEVRVHVSVDLRALDEVRLKFAVTDTGPGIPEEEQRLLFVPFSRLDLSETRVHGGTGLGLAICRQLVDHMGGEIYVNSRPRVGSTFAFDLWLRYEANASAPTPPVLVPQPRVMVVDDSAAVRAAILVDLELLGVDGSANESPREAFEMIIAAAAVGRPYSVVLVDVDLDDGGATWLLHAVRDEGRLSGLSVVFLTRSVSTTWLDVMAHGALPALRKPVRTERLLGMFASLADGGRARDQRSAAAVGWRAPRRADGSLRRVLVVEDQELNRRVAVGMLTALGVDVDLAVDGAEALTKLEPGRFDAVFMDCQMPRMDGLEATRLWRGREGSASHVPIVAMTAYASPVDRARCLAAGMDDHISKPISMDQLTDALRRWLGAADVIASGVEPQRDQGMHGAIDDIRERYSALRSVMGAPEVDALVSLYETESAAALDGIADAVERRDAPQLEAAAHSLKSASLNLGASRVVSSCEVLVLRARANALDGLVASELVPPLREQVREACEMLRALRA